MAAFPNPLSLVGKDVEPVYGDIMQQMSNWVETLALNTANLDKISLTSDKLTRLIYVGSIIWPIASEWHPKRGHHEDEIDSTH